MTEVSKLTPLNNTQSLVQGRLASGGAVPQKCGLGTVTVIIGHMTVNYDS